MITAPTLSAQDHGTPARRRDAGRTRDLLLQAARQRFARQGYAATTVREIAEDAGVNVALINRYFTSKARLFEACLLAAVDDLQSLETPGDGQRGTPEVMVRRLIAADDRRARQILPLLLRTAGDEHAEQVRVGILRRFAHGIAGFAAPDRGIDEPGEPAEPDRAVLLRAQFVVAALIGLALQRDMPGLDPVASASEDELIGPMRDLLAGLFPT